MSQVGRTDAAVPAEPLNRGRMCECVSVYGGGELRERGRETESEAGIRRKYICHLVPLQSEVFGCVHLCVCVSVMLKCSCVCVCVHKHLCMSLGL